MKIKTIILLPALFVLALFSASCSVTENIPDDNAAGSGSAAADRSSENDFPDICSFNATTLDGGEFSEADLEGYDLTMINIWQTSCGPCVREMPQLADLNTLLPENVQMITYCLDGGYFPEEAASILAKAGLEALCLTDSDGDMLDLINVVMYVPTTVFVDSGGRQIGEAQIGAPRNAADFYKDAINQALRQLGKDEMP